MQFQWQVQFKNEQVCRGQMFDVAHFTIPHYVPNKNMENYQIRHWV
jgi:hypothetical protein